MLSVSLSLKRPCAYSPTCRVYRIFKLDPAYPSAEPVEQLVAADVEAYQRDPSIWGLDADKFNPDRWATLVNQKLLAFGARLFLCPASADVLPHTGLSRVPENPCFIPEQIVFKKERFVYQFCRLDSGSIEHTPRRVLPKAPVVPAKALKSRLVLISSSGITSELLRC